MYLESEAACNSSGVECSWHTDEISREVTWWMMPNKDLATPFAGNAMLHRLGSDDSIRGSRVLTQSAGNSSNDSTGVR